MELVDYCFDTRHTDIMSSRSGLYPREAVHRLASPQTSFGVRSSRIHFSPTDGFSYERVAQFNLEWIFSKLDSGFQSLVGFRILSAGFRIPKPRIPDSTSKKFLDSGIRIPLRGANQESCLGLESNPWSSVATCHWPSCVWLVQPRRIVSQRCFLSNLEKKMVEKNYEDDQNCPLWQSSPIWLSEEFFESNYFRIE